MHEDAEVSQVSRMNSVLRVAGVLFIGVVALTAYFAARHWQDTQSAYPRAEAASDCDLRLGPCSLPLNGGVVEFAIEPATIPLMQTLQLVVRTENINVEAVRVEIRGLNMEMGLNRTQLKQVSAGHWQGETILPICSQRRMLWEAAVQLDGVQRAELPFAFETVRP